MMNNLELIITECERELEYWFELNKKTPYSDVVLREVIVSNIANLSRSLHRCMKLRGRCEEK